MTLLESVIAAVILGVTAVACLGATQGAVRLQQRSVAWQEAVADAESALASATQGASQSGGLPADASVQRRVYNERLDMVEVSVPVRGGGAYRVARLVERTPSSDAGELR